MLGFKEIRNATPHTPIHLFLRHAYQDPFSPRKDCPPSQSPLALLGSPYSLDAPFGRPKHPNPPEIFCSYSWRSFMVCLFLPPAYSGVQALRL